MPQPVKLECLKNEPEDTADDDFLEAVHEEDAASHISGRDGAGGAVGRVVRAGGAALSPAWEGAAAGGSRAHAADLLFAAVVQPVGPGGGRGTVRLRGDAAVRGHCARLGA